MPLEGFLVKVTRKSEHVYKTTEILEVSFAELVVPEKCDARKILKFRKLIYYKL